MFAATHNAIRAHFTTGVEGLDVDLGPIRHDNDETAAIPTAGRYCRVAVQPRESRQISLGPTARFRETGVVTVELFEPLGRGDKTVNENADAVASIFRGESATSGTTRVRFEAPSIGPGTRAGSYWLRILTIPYRADDFFVVA